VNTVRLVAIEVVIGFVLSLAASIGVLYAIGNDGTTPLIEGTSVFLMAMGIGILAWIVLLIAARRVTALRGPGARILASFLAATAAIVVNAILLGIVLAVIGDGALEFLFFIVPASMAFALAALIANLLTHLVIARATPPATAATP
jgi:hypothetical protein